MRSHRLLSACLVLLAAVAQAATPVYVSPDVPTDETVTFSTIPPWTTARYAGVAGYTPAFTIPGNPVIDALHRQDGKGDWLFSFEAATDLGGLLPVPADPRDVVAYDGSTSTYSILLCGSPVGIPPSSNVDALYQDLDTGPLFLSFDVPTTIGPNTFDPSDIVRFDRIGPGCGGWAAGAANPVFDASAAGVPVSANVIGADASGGRFILDFDAPVDLGPPGPVTYVPGQLVAWDGLTWSIYETLAGWPLSGGVDGMSLAANPGIVPPTIHVDKAPGGDITLSWSASCSQGAEDYGIYQGKIGTWYSHTLLDCSDAGGDRIETVTPFASSGYYLVVPLGGPEEGSYGTNSAGVQRPVGTATCLPVQLVTPCPP